VLDPYLPRERARLKAEVRDHLLWGGFPEVITLPRPDKRPQLDEYFNVLLFRDLIERHGILQPVVVKHFLKRMLASATKPVSVSKVDQMLRSAGIRTTKALLYDWLDHALDTHLLIRCDRFGASATERLTSTTRFFCTDNGLLTAVTGSFKDEWGKLLENATAVEAVRQGWGISYYKEKRECDLVLSANGRPMRCVQVCWSIQDPETRQRELAGLAEACAVFGVKEGTVVTFEEREDIKAGKLRVRVVPFWEAGGALKK
ncbi:MAG TPA: DUF4143 domain-containing protein, partial [Flavobacteriales bacterium]|nr:DUF4143 domain-containing protein [Flavobacteriales bacterium]